LHSEAERVALEYADAITITDHDVSDALFSRLRQVDGDDEIVERTQIVAWDNASRQFHCALRIPAQGPSQREQARWDLPIESFLLAPRWNALPWCEPGICIQDQLRIGSGGLQMASETRIALVGDYNPDVPAHRAIPQALQIAAEGSGCTIRTEWVATEQLSTDAPHHLAHYGGIWVAPGSPYRSMEGALAAIKYARTRNVPFLGTCGGYQHVLIEYARNVLGLQQADHAETNPDASVLFISPLTCALRGVNGAVHFKPGSRIARIYGATECVEQYNCGFGLNPEYRPLLERSALSITAEDDLGDARVIELEDHPFFIATLYQPERSAFRGVRHPVISAFAGAASVSD
jgi:CTP synthase (UTP-ammonia lyase)